MDRPPVRAWYKKKRYILSLVGIGIVLIGLNTSGGANTTEYSQSRLQQVPTATTNYVTAPTKTQETTLSNENYYTNTAGNQVHSPAYSNTGSIPSGATAQCRDGTYSFSASRRGTCSHHGGVASWL